ncbi:MAG: hypothetical protein DRJ03_27695 [Chloroflexi bacterium]|nr:MAG: hypothetical protein DRJ03_27695 [Chloroflexota bacterium]
MMDKQPETARVRALCSKLIGMLGTVLDTMTPSGVNPAVCEAWWLTARKLSGQDHQTTDEVIDALEPTSGNW